MGIFDRLPFGKILIAAAIVVYGWATWLVLLRPHDLPYWFAENSGFFEVAPPFIYLPVAAAFLLLPYFRRRAKWIIAVLCLLMGARELDIHERVTEGGFLFFPVGFKADYPSLYALIETSAVSLAVVLLLAMVYAYRHVVRRNLERRDPHQLLMLAGWLGIGAAIALDGLDNKINDTFGIHLPLWLPVIANVMEETTEFLIPVCFAFGLLAFYQARHQGRYDAADSIYDIG